MNICTDSFKHPAYGQTGTALSLFMTFITTASPALAFQEHGPPEGLYIHQLGHILFAASMLGLWYGVRVSRFNAQRSWRLIAYGAALLALWNGVTFTGHWLSIFTIPAMYSSGEEVPEWMLRMWHVLKLDNIVCISAMLCFYAGLRNHQQSAGAARNMKRRKT
jgi:hypothetical protein